MFGGRDLLNGHWPLIYLPGRLTRFNDLRLRQVHFFSFLISNFFLLCRPRASFPGATNETLLQKFNSVNKDNDYYEVPQKREAAFIVRHYAGKVKYQSNEFREKNLDLMKADIVAVLKSSQYAFVRELVGGDPVAVFRWAILRAFIRAYFAFIESGKRHRGEFFNIFENFHFHFHFDLI